MSGSFVSACPAARRKRAEREPFRQRVDRIDQRQAGETRLIDDAVGMHHLQVPSYICSVPET